MSEINMRKQRKPRQTLGKGSSFFVYPLALVVILAVLILAFLGNLILLTAFLLFLFFICLISRLWGLRVLKNVELQVTAPPYRIHAGETAEIFYHIKNRKFLPLIWLEVIQRLPSNGCLRPIDQDEIGEFPLPEEKITALNNEYIDRQDAASQAGQRFDEPAPKLTGPVFEKKFAFILWHQELEWASQWVACRRGIYVLDSVILHSGDGFGLTKMEQKFCPEPRPIFAVYPRLIPVRPDALLNTVWNSQAKDKGYLEDPTVIRSERSYQPFDSWKRIDWRLAARGQELEVKLFDMILPKSMHFIIDAASFTSEDREQQELEEMISLVASLVVDLSEKRVSCGLSLPETEFSPSVDLPEGTETEELLFALAGLDCSGKVCRINSDTINRLCDSAGQVLLCTHSVTSPGNRRFLAEIGNVGVTLIVHEHFDPSKDAGPEGCRILPAAALKDGGHRG